MRIHVTEVKVAGNVFEVAVRAEIDKVIGTTFVYRSLEASEVGLPVDKAQEAGCS